MASISIPSRYGKVSALMRIGRSSSRPSRSAIIQSDWKSRVYRGSAVPRTSFRNIAGLRLLARAIMIPTIKKPFPLRRWNVLLCVGASEGRPHNKNTAERKRLVSSLTPNYSTGSGSTPNQHSHFTTQKPSSKTPPPAKVSTGRMPRTSALG